MNVLEMPVLGLVGALALGCQAPPARSEAAPAPAEATADEEQAASSPIELRHTVDCTSGTPTEAPETRPASVGQVAPDFELPAYHDGEFTTVKLSDHRGKWVVLCFYPGDFTFV